MPHALNRGRATGLARSLWDDAAPVWEDFQEGGLDYSREAVHGPALLKALGDLHGKKVLDVGCGQGRFTRRLARRGARVSAIDWSARMLSFAIVRERAKPLGIRYRHGDARHLDQLWARGSFDVGVACMSLMDMPNPERVLRAISRVLRSRGRLVFSVVHPLNSAEVGWERPRAPDRGAMRIDHYFDHRVVPTQWRMERLRRPFDTLTWHWTFEDWFRTLDLAGFEVEGLTEPHATVAQAKKNPLLAATRRIPFFAVFACRKRRARSN